MMLYLYTRNIAAIRTLITIHAWLSIGFNVPVPAPNTLQVISIQYMHPLFCGDIVLDQNIHQLPRSSRKYRWSLQVVNKCYYHCTECEKSSSQSAILCSERARARSREIICHCTVDTSNNRLFYLVRCSRLQTTQSARYQPPGTDRGDVVFETRSVPLRSEARDRFTSIIRRRLVTRPDDCVTLCDITSRRHLPHGD